MQHVYIILKKYDNIYIYLFIYLLGSLGPNQIFLGKNRIKPK